MTSIEYVFRVDGMHCGGCALLIDDALEDVPGVQSSQTSVKRRQSVVVLDPAQCDPAAVAVTINELGYTASATES